MAEHCFWALDAPVARVAATDTFVPYEPTLEQAVLPQVDDIVAAAPAGWRRPDAGAASIAAWTAWW